MKLVEKKTLEHSKLLEQQNEIDRGLKLARRVDEIREKKVKEEQDLEKWRTETLRIVQEEIDRKIAERDRLIQETREAEIARFYVEAPLDVQEEREKTRKITKENEKVSFDLLSREARLIERESSVAEQQESLFEQDIDLKEKEKLAQGYLEERKRAYESARTLESEAKRAKERADEHIESEYEELFIAKERFALDKKNLENEQEALEREKLDIEDQKLHIRSQQETLRAAWEAIRKLKSHT